MLYMIGVVINATNLMRINRWIRIFAVDEWTGRYLSRHAVLKLQTSTL